MELILQKLTEFGLSDKESRVFLAALELGPSPVQDISHRAKVNRATTYVMIESLTNRGLMSTFQKGKKRYYVAESPERLLSVIHAQQRVVESKRAQMEELLPSLLSMYNAEGAKPQVRYLEGAEGVKTVRAIFEKLKGDSVEIVPLDDVHGTRELMGDEREAHHKALRERGNAFRGIAVTSNMDPSCLPELGEGEWRMLPPAKFSIHGSINVRADHVFLFSYRSAILSVVIRSHEIADTLRAMFDLAWEAAKEYPNKICKK